MAEGTKERHLEDQVEHDLLLQGYHSLTSRQYDQELCVVPTELILFIQETQPEVYKALREQYGPNTDERISQNVSRFIGKYGILDAFRKGVKDRGQTIRLYYSKPSSTKNEEHWERYRKNRYGIIRQLYFSKKKPQDSIDVVLFLNGIPIITSELKNALTGQYVSDAEKQYRDDRHPTEPLLAYKRCLVHFALGTMKASMTTRLAGDKTRFFPYNLELVNPANPTGFSTDYVWKDVWSRDSILELVQHYVHIQINTEKEFDKITGGPSAQSRQTIVAATAGRRSGRVLPHPAFCRIR
jgi:type I restriction enzyme R subunit